MTEKDQHSSKKPTSDKGSLKRRSVLVIGMSGIFILLLTFLVYTPALKNDFVWDDVKYVCENTKIQSLNFQSLYWMLTSSHASNWHPLTWLSHAIDYSFWGLNPFGHHLTNIILHGLNTLLVFLLVIRLMSRAQEVTRMSSPSKMPLLISTNSFIGAGITASLFSLHPLRVESVAWVAERKDLLCAFFVLLSIISYLSYTSSVIKRYRWIWFSTCLLLFLLALMSKPMAVSLPLILLLLDLYPLKRLEPYFGKNLSILLEKIPFFVLSIASGVITIIAQHSGGAIESFERLSISLRLLNALYSLVFYLKKMIWPLELIPFYPYPKYVFLLDPQYLISGILVLAITGSCFWMVKKGKYLFFVAWSYYLITLFPVLGIIQVGGQAAADRYTYLPSIGILLVVGVALVWGWEKSSLTRRKLKLRGLLLICLCTVIFFLSYLTINQIRIWQNPEIFWSYIISAFPKTFPEAYDSLGIVYVKKGRLDEAISVFKKALNIKPNYADAHYNLGVAYHEKGVLDEAISEYKKALTINPNDAMAHVNLGTAYKDKHRLDEAISEFKKALIIKSNFAEAYLNLGVAYYEKGTLDKAISEFKQTIEIMPDYADAHHNLAVAYYSKGNYKLAIVHYNKAVELGGRVNPKLIELLKPYL